MGPCHIHTCIPAPALCWAWEAQRRCEPGPLPFAAVLKSQNDEARQAQRQARLEQISSPVQLLPLLTAEARPSTQAARTVSGPGAIEAYAPPRRSGRFIDQIA